MRSFLIKQPVPRIRGKVVLPGDKSIAHRSLIISAIAHGKTTIYNLALNDDNLTTLAALKKLGVRISQVKKQGTGGCLTVTGCGLAGLTKPRGPLFLGESGTTFRLLLGLLAGQDFSTVLTAGNTLAKRPMRRVTEPLRLMGACINARRIAQGARREEYPPITIQGGFLKGIIYRLPVASAQVKSAILLAGLYAEGRTTVIEENHTRNHTERMLELFKAKIVVRGDRITVQKTDKLISPGRIYIPGDISSAAFFIVPAAILPKSKLILADIGLNPSRIGIIKVLRRMGAGLAVKMRKSRGKSYEPAGDLIVKSSSLKGTTVAQKEIPLLIDELPILMVAASVAKGRTVLKDIGELRVKETDRIRSMVENLRKMGANIRVMRHNGSEDIVIEGVKELKGARVRSFGDHRTAMSMVVAGLAAKGKTHIDDVSCISKSFPEFLKILATLCG